MFPGKPSLRCADLSTTYFVYAIDSEICSIKGIRECNRPLYIGIEEPKVEPKPKSQKTTVGTEAQRPRQTHKGATGIIPNQKHKSDFPQPGT